MPILEYDPVKTAVITPSGGDLAVPEHCIICFFQDVIDGLREIGSVEEIGHRASEMGKHPVYGATINGARIGVFHPGVGAPLAAGFLDELIAGGGRKFIACGGAGALDKHLTLGHLVVPNAAVRDEGTSYHYLPPSRDVVASPEAVAAIEATLTKHGVPYVVGKTWTTDAIYRETRERVNRRRDEGCLTVEMEAAAFFAVAQFRGVTFGQILYSGDDLTGDEWDSRDWQTQSDVRRRMFELAAEACLLL